MTAALQAIASPRRRELLRLCWAQPRAAGELHRALGDVSFGAVSQHLRVLAEAGLVAGERRGKERWYIAVPEALGPLRAALEAEWGDALYRLKLLAELEETRRGPRAQPPRRPPRRGKNAPREGAPRKTRPRRRP